MDMIDHVVQEHDIQRASEYLLIDILRNICGKAQLNAQCAIYV